MKNVVVQGRHDDRVMPFLTTSMSGLDSVIKATTQQSGMTRKGGASAR